MAFIDRAQHVTVDEIVSQILDLADHTPGQDRPARIHSVLMDVMTQLAPVLRREREVCRQTRKCTPAAASCDS